MGTAGGQEDSDHSGDPSMCSSMLGWAQPVYRQLSTCLTQATEEVLNGSLLSGGYAGFLRMLSWEASTPEGHQQVLREVGSSEGEGPGWLDRQLGRPKA